MECNKLEKMTFTTRQLLALKDRHELNADTVQLG